MTADKALLRAALRARRSAYVAGLDAAAVVQMRARLADIVLPHLADARAARSHR